MSKQLSQAEYILKKYLNPPKEEEFKREKKRKKISSKAKQQIKIIDQDIDLDQLKPPSDDDNDLLNTQEDKPVIAGIQQDKFIKQNAWKKLTTDDPSNDPNDDDYDLKTTNSQKVKIKNEPVDSDGDYDVRQTLSNSNTKIKQEQDDDYDLSDLRSKTNFNTLDVQKSNHHDQDDDYDFSKINLSKIKQEPISERQQQSQLNQRSNGEHRGHHDRDRDHDHRNHREHRDHHSKRNERDHEREHERDKRKSHRDYSPKRDSHRDRERDVDRRRGHHSERHEHSDRHRKHDHKHDRNDKHRSHHERHRSVSPKRESHHDRHKRKDYDESRSSDHRKRSRNQHWVKEEQQERHGPRTDHAIKTREYSEQEKRELLGKIFEKSDDETEESRQKKQEDMRREHDLKKKYELWNKGVKQVKEKESQMANYEHEMNKPLARYEDDQDRDRLLRERELAEDPMLEYIRRKKKIKSTKESLENDQEVLVYPKYSGSAAPPQNRFGIMPGYRWDGVDRSNGFEVKLLSKQNESIATQEEAYRWSTADM